MSTKGKKRKETVATSAAPVDLEKRKAFRIEQEVRYHKQCRVHELEKAEVNYRQAAELKALRATCKQERCAEADPKACFYCKAAVADVEIGEPRSGREYAWQRKDKTTCVHCEHSRKCVDCEWTVMCAYQDWHGFCGFCVDAANICSYCDGGCSVCQADAGCCRSNGSLGCQLDDEQKTWSYRETGERPDPYEEARELSRLRDKYK